MSKESRRAGKHPLTTAEKLGHVWAWAFLAMVAILLVTLLGKVFLTPS